MMRGPNRNTNTMAVAFIAPPVTERGCSRNTFRNEIFDPENSASQ